MGGQQKFDLKEIAWGGECAVDLFGLEYGAVSGSYTNGYESEVLYRKSSSETISSAG